MLNFMSNHINILYIYIYICMYSIDNHGNETYSGCSAVHGYCCLNLEKCNLSTSTTKIFQVKSTSRPVSSCHRSYSKIILKAVTMANKLKNHQDNLCRFDFLRHFICVYIYIYTYNYNYIYIYIYAPHFSIEPKFRTSQSFL